MRDNETLPWPPDWRALAVALAKRVRDDEWALGDALVAIEQADAGQVAPQIGPTQEDYTALARKTDRLRQAAHALIACGCVDPYMRETMSLAEALEAFQEGGR